MQKSCTRTKRENSVKICAKNKSSEQRVCRSSARTHTGTRTMLPDTNRDEHWHTVFSNFTCHSIGDSLRWICSLKIHSATRRQNPIPIFAREEHMSEMRGQGVHAKALRIRAFWSERQNSWMPGTRAAEQHQRRRRNAELLEIQTHDRWTRVRVQQIPSRTGQKQTL